MTGNFSKNNHILVKIYGTKIFKKIANIDKILFVALVHSSRPLALRSVSFPKLYTLHHTHLGGVTLSPSGVRAPNTLTVRYSFACKGSARSLRKTCEGQLSSLCSIVRVGCHQVFGIFDLFVRAEVKRFTNSNKVVRSTKAWHCLPL